jgi:RecA-family ATPase
MEAFWEAQALDAMEEAAQQQREHEIALQLDQAKRDWAAFKKAEDLVQERKTYAQRKGEMKSRGLKATEKQASEIHTRTGHGSAVSRMMADLIAATREPLPRPARAL